VKYTNGNEKKSLFMTAQMINLGLKWQYKWHKISAMGKLVAENFSVHTEPT
jgi:hypothetical protein